MYALIRTASLVENNVFTPEVMAVELTPQWVHAVARCIGAAGEAGRLHDGMMHIAYSFTLPPCWMLKTYDEHDEGWQSYSAQLVARVAMVAEGAVTDYDGIHFFDQLPMRVFEEQVDTEVDRLLVHLQGGEPWTVTLRAYPRKLDEEFETVRIPMPAIEQMHEVATRSYISEGSAQ